MAFLDKKTRIIDFCLTERGRDLLAKNQLRIKHYAFSDDLIDYSGSLVQNIQTSASIDDIVYRNYVPMEATSLGGFGAQRDLLSFLYTCPEQRASLPPFELSFSGSVVSGAVNLTRICQDVSYNALVSNYVSADTPSQQNMVVIIERDDTTINDREKQYASEQDLDRLNVEDPQLINLVKR